MYAVIDVETTGFAPGKDRVIEVAVVALNERGVREWEWCTLINPERDTGHGMAVKVHQIYPRDVASAPTFREYAGYLAYLLSGRVLIGHNVTFDWKMLGAEFELCGFGTPDPMPVICTMNIARDAGLRPYRLDACCESFNIPFCGAHHALADARATAQLANAMFDFGARNTVDVARRAIRDMPTWPTIPVAAHEPVVRPIPPSRGEPPRWGPGATVDIPVPPLAGSSLSASSSDGDYIAALDKAIEDREITDAEADELAAVSRAYGITDDRLSELHREYLRILAGDMWSDGLLSSHEEADLRIVARLLGLGADDVAHVICSPAGSDLAPASELRVGEKVVFTGEMSFAREQWKARCEEAGLRVTGSVSGKTNWLVVPFGSTGSSKSLRARELGVRVVSEQAFSRMVSRLESAQLAKGDGA